VPTAARCAIERLMKRLGLRGAVRNKAKRTTVAGKNANPAEDLVKRKFDAPKPDHLWVADLTYAPHPDRLVLHGFRHRCFRQDDSEV
jgi:transposase InsO family protein